jgi:hypothetical protein
MGRTLAEWHANDTAEASAAPDGISWRTIENVELVHGATISVGRALNGGKPGRFDRVEIVRVDRAEAPLTFDIEFMRQRGALAQFRFPGVDGLYNMRVAYVNDPEGKATFAVSVRNPDEPETSPPTPPRGR